MRVDDNGGPMTVLETAAHVRPASRSTLPVAYCSFDHRVFPFWYDIDGCESSEATVLESQDKCRREETAYISWQRQSEEKISH